LHPPDGEKRGGADAASLLAPLVMQVLKTSAIFFLPNSVSVNNTKNPAENYQ